MAELPKDIILHFYSDDGITISFDATPLVRCKDCRYSGYWYGDKSICFLWHENGIDVFNDGYCSYGIAAENSIPVSNTNREKPSDRKEQT